MCHHVACHMVLPIEEMACLPAPSAEQCAAFVEHVSWAHSWYKHLSLVTPSRFVVFVAADAGVGHDEASPRHHYSWRTTAEYRSRFGYLDYQWRIRADEGWRRDVDPVIDLPSEVAGACEFDLGPLCSNDFNAIEVICSFWSSATGEGGWYPEEQSLVPAPVRARIDRLAELVMASDHVYDELSDSEKALAFADERSESTPGLARYDAASARVAAFYEELRRPECARIELALTRLSALLAVARE